MPPTDAEVAADRRGDIAREYATLRNTIEKTYVSDKVALENTYLAALKSNRLALAAAYVAEGLNPDGTDPQGRPQG